MRFVFKCLVNVCYSVVFIIPLFLTKFTLNKELESFYGLRIRDFTWKTYLNILLMIFPFIIIASFQKDFLNTICSFLSDKLYVRYDFFRFDCLPYVDTKAFFACTIVICSLTVHLFGVYTAVPFPPLLTRMALPKVSGNGCNASCKVY